MNQNHSKFKKDELLNSANEFYISQKFVLNGKKVENGPSWNMSLKKAGSMRFRWNETNSLRNEFLSVVSDGKDIAPLELIHSKNVFCIESSDEIKNKTGDGILTLNKNVFPVITVADCVPIYLFDSGSGAFGVLHSGWKGTGICEKAVELLVSKYGAEKKNICAAIGPHINSCCYSVEKCRAEYFIENFGEKCVQPLENDKFSLSLTEANLFAFKKAGIPEENIIVSNECTCCSGEKFGSFRRETSVLPETMSLEEKSRLFTVQAAWVKW